MEILLQLSCVAALFLVCWLYSRLRYRCWSESAHAPYCRPFTPPLVFGPSESLLTPPEIPEPACVYVDDQGRRVERYGANITRVRALREPPAKELQESRSG